MKPKLGAHRKATADGAAAIAAYAKAQSSEHEAICDSLEMEIRAALPQAAPRIWHAMPVWFIGENPIVWYNATPKHVNLLFWSGQSFKEPALQAAGKFRATQTQYTNVAQIDAEALRRWLEKAGKDIWNYAALRAAAKPSGSTR